MEMSVKECWVTLATTESYASGALVLSRSLKRSETSRPVAVLVVSSNLSPSTLGALKGTFDAVIDIGRELDSGDAERLKLLGRPELGVTLSKIKVWTLTQYDKCVFLDADTLVLRNCDELFEERDEFSAAPDAGWPDCFNSGVFVFRPNMETYNSLLQLAGTTGSFDGGDQGLLNTFFSDWSTSDASKRLPFIYNTTANATYSYLPAYKKFGNNVKIVHFIGWDSKPWLSKSDVSGSGIDQKHKKLWWEIYENEVVPIFQQNTNVSRKEEDEPSEKFLESNSGSSNGVSRKEDWEHGHPDYLGRDSFDNILSKINNTMKNDGEE